MHIVQVIDNLQLVGGAQRLQVLFAQAVSGRDHSLTVVSLQKDENSPISRQLRALGVQVLFFPGKSLIDPIRFRHLYRFFGSEPVDVIHTHLTFANILGMTIGWLRGIPVVTSIHNERIQKRRYHALKFGLETFLLRNAARRVIAVGHTTRDAHRQRLTGKDILVVSNAVQMPPNFSSKQRTAIREELTGDASSPVLISVGRLVPQKGYEDLITAFERVAKEYPKARLIIVGEGHLRNQLEEYRDSLQLTDRISFLGARTDVPLLLASSDIYVNSSLWEGLSISLLEAMAAGLPIIATDVGDAPQVVAETAGVLVPPGHPKQISQAVCDLLATPSKAQSLGSAAREYARRRHHPEVWADQILAIYESITDRPDRLTSVRVQ